MSRIVQPPKLLGETRAYVFDFRADMGAGVTISSTSTAASVYSGTDASPSSILSGSGAISGSSVTQKLTGGVLGVIYDVLVSATLSDGQVVQRASYIAIAPDLT